MSSKIFWLWHVIKLNIKCLKHKQQSFQKTNESRDRPESNKNLMIKEAEKGSAAVIIDRE